MHLYSTDRETLFSFCQTVRLITILSLAICKKNVVVFQVNTCQSALHHEDKSD